MKPRSLTLSFLAFAFLSACVPAMTTSPVVLSQTPTMTAHPIPSMTFTPSITPLPTIPTFSPTFDVRTIVTVTPGEKALSPKKRGNIEFDTKTLNSNYPTYDLDDVFASILRFLNDGGDAKTIRSELLKKNYAENIHNSTFEIDLTNDGVPEFIVKIDMGFAIFGCSGGKYKILISSHPAVDFTILLGVEDMNRNGIPEVVHGIVYCGFACIELSIDEWNGVGFSQLFDRKNPIVPPSVKIMDINNDNLLELVAFYPFVGMCCLRDYIPMRDEKVIYAWNGKMFTFSKKEIAPPKYRFQAVQDGDSASEQKEYNYALQFYQEAIFSDKLDWWSAERRVYEVTLYNDLQNPDKPTSPPLPAPDPTEYPRLAAYSYYRIMILHIARGLYADAETTYETLLQKFPEGNAGYPYAEMAISFWNAYQSSHNMTNACGAAIQYAAEHPEILIPLGSDYHSAQSRLYKPEDVCPFR